MDKNIDPIFSRVISAESGVVKISVKVPANYMLSEFLVFSLSYKLSSCECYGNDVSLLNVQVENRVGAPILYGADVCLDQEITGNIKFVLDYFFFCQKFLCKKREHPPSFEVYKNKCFLIDIWAVNGFKNEMPE